MDIKSRPKRRRDPLRVRQQRRLVGFGVGTSGRVLCKNARWAACVARVGPGFVI